MGLRIAAEHNIPVLNLGSITPRQACEQLQAMREAHLRAGADLAQDQSPQRHASAAATPPRHPSQHPISPATSAASASPEDTWGAFSNFQHLAAPIAAGPWTFATSEHL